MLQCARADLLHLIEMIEWIVLPKWNQSRKTNRIRDLGSFGFSVLVISVACFGLGFVLVLRFLLRLLSFLSGLGLLF